MALYACNNPQITGSPAPWNRPSAGAACVAFASSTVAAPEKRPSLAAAGAALGAVVGAAVRFPGGAIPPTCGPPVGAAVDATNASDAFTASK